MQRILRMKREVKMLEESPPPGVHCWPLKDSIENLEAQIIGSEGSPYSGGIFKLHIQIPERYPFEPPKVKFGTQVYHPNIDTAGRICLDILKMPPKGAWKPSLNIGTVLTSIQLLMNDPNPEDPLMTDIANEFKYNRPSYRENAIEWTKKYAKEGSSSTTTYNIQMHEKENENSTSVKTEHPNAFSSDHESMLEVLDSDDDLFASPQKKTTQQMSPNKRVLQPSTYNFTAKKSKT